MASQNILENTTPSSGTMVLTTATTATIFVGGYLGWSFDLNISSTSAAGSVQIFTQNTNPTGDTFTQAAITTYVVTSGKFPSTNTRVTVDSNNVTTASWVIIKWLGSDASNGTIQIVGQQNIF